MRVFCSHCQMGWLKSIRAIIDRLRKKKDEIIIICDFRFVLSTRFIPIPNTRPIWDIAPFDIHSLGTTIPAVKSDAKPYRVCILPSNLFSNIHQFAADSFSPVFFQYTEINNLGQSFSAERTAEPCYVYTHIPGRLSLIYGCQ